MLGLTGNIACGKSTVGRLLAEQFGVDYVDADALVHALYRPGTPETMLIAERFGQDLLQADGTIDRRRLGDIVMADPASKRRLEELLQPSIYRAIDARITQSSERVVVLDAIRLFEAGWADRCQAVWVVTCDRPAQLRRLMETRGWTEQQATLRIDAQAPQEEKVSRASAVLDNRGDEAELLRQVSDAWRETVAPLLAAEGN